MNFNKETFDISSLFELNNAALVCCDEENDSFQGENEALGWTPRVSGPAGGNLDGTTVFGSSKLHRTTKNPDAPRTTLQPPRRTQNSLEPP